MLPTRDFLPVTVFVPTVPHPKKTPNTKKTLCGVSAEQPTLEAIWVSEVSGRTWLDRQASLTTLDDGDGSS
jgi:hypothetical protein